MGSHFLYEIIAECMWRAVGWVCDQRPNAVIDSLKVCHRYWGNERWSTESRRLFLPYGTMVMARSATSEDVKKDELSIVGAGVPVLLHEKRVITCARNRICTSTSTSETSLMTLSPLVLLVDVLSKSLQEMVKVALFTVSRVSTLAWRLSTTMRCGGCRWTKSGGEEHLLRTARWLSAMRTVWGSLSGWKVSGCWSWCCSWRLPLQRRETLLHCKRVDTELTSTAASSGNAKTHVLPDRNINTVSTVRGSFRLTQSTHHVYIRDESRRLFVEMSLMESVQQKRGYLAFDYDTELTSTAKTGNHKTDVLPDENIITVGVSRSVVDERGQNWMRNVFAHTFSRSRCAKRMCSTDSERTQASPSLRRQFCLFWQQSDPPSTRAVSLFSCFIFDAFPELSWTRIVHLVCKRLVFFFEKWSTESHKVETWMEVA